LFIVKLSSYKSHKKTLSTTSPRFAEAARYTIRKYGELPHIRQPSRLVGGIEYAANGGMASPDV